MVNDAPRFAPTQSGAVCAFDTLRSLAGRAPIWARRQACHEVPWPAGRTFAAKSFSWGDARRPHNSIDLDSFLMRGDLLVMYSRSNSAPVWPLSAPIGLLLSV